MNMLANLSMDGIAQAGDVLVQSPFRTLESAVYDFTVDTAYLRTTTTKAVFLELVLKADDGTVLRDSLCLVNGVGKGNTNFYLDKKTGEKKLMPGFESANDLSCLTIGKLITSVADEKKVIKLYDYDAGKELPTEVPMLVDLLGAKVKAGVLKKIVNKRVDNGAGQYVDGPESREINEIDKFFHADTSKTKQELELGAAEASFIDSWKERNEGVTQDRRTIKDGATGMPTGMPAATPGASAPATPPLFS